MKRLTHNHKKMKAVKLTKGQRRRKWIHEIEKALFSVLCDVEFIEPKRKARK